MAATKSYSVMLGTDPTTCAASGTVNSNTLNLTTAYGATITAIVTNGSTPPTLPCSATLYTSGDGTTWRAYSNWPGGTAASTAYPMTWTLDISVMYCYVSFTGNTGQAVSVACEAQIATGV